MPMRSEEEKESPRLFLAAGAGEILAGELSSQRADYMQGEDNSDGADGDGLKRHQSQMELQEAEMELLLQKAEESSPEYAQIVAHATKIENVACDVWGASIWFVVHDLPDLRAGRMVFEGKVRSAYVLFVYVCNFMIQGTLVYYIFKLLLLPGLLESQDIYKNFHKVAFGNAAFDSEQFDDMSGSDKASLCGIALSNVMFVRIVLFLWVTNNVGYLRNCIHKMICVLSLPELPAGLDTRLMKRDIKASKVENNIICLNVKGKVGLICIVFIPKIVICGMLTVTGCIWLMTSLCYADLILNSLALAFVLKVDELLAEVFFPNHFLAEVDDLAFVLPGDESDADTQMDTRTWEYFYCSLSIFGSMMAVEMLILFQPVMPGYVYDVPGACMSYLNEQLPWCAPWALDCFPVH